MVYQTLNSLQVYLVVSQNKPHVTLYYREEDGSWWVSAYENLDQIISLPCPSIQLALADIYDGVVFTNTDDA